MNPVLTVQEAAQVLKVQPLFVYQLCETGKLRHSRLGKGKRARIRIQEADLAAYLEQHAQGPASMAKPIESKEKPKKAASETGARRPINYEHFSWYKKQQKVAGK